MPERDERAKESETRMEPSDRRSPPSAPRAEGQDGSLKVHGDKLEKLIPKGSRE